MTRVLVGAEKQRRLRKGILPKEIKKLFLSSWDYK